MNVILASASPRRAKLLSQVGIQFKVAPSSLEETFSKKNRPEKIVQILAKQKAEDVAKQWHGQFVIAADTIVCFQNEILGKPSNNRQATEYLKKLSGQTHEVLSGVYAGPVNSVGTISTAISFYERTKVTFSSLTEKEIEKYIQYGQPLDKAGSYGIQDDLGSLFVEKINGDYYNVVGFPLHRFYNTLKKEMPDIHEKLFFPTS